MSNESPVLNLPQTSDFATIQFKITDPVAEESTFIQCLIDFSIIETYLQGVNQGLTYLPIEGDRNKPIDLTPYSFWANFNEQSQPDLSFINSEPSIASNREVAVEVKKLPSGLDAFKLDSMQTIISSPNSDFNWQQALIFADGNEYEFDPGSVTVSFDENNPNSTSVLLYTTPEQPTQDVETSFDMLFSFALDGSTFWGKIDPLVKISTGGDGG